MSGKLPDISFKSCLSTFATGVAVVTTSVDSQYHGITVNSFSSVSLHPPLVLFSLEKKAFRFSIFASAKHFAINILAETQRDFSRMFAEKQHVVWSGILEKTVDHTPILSGILSYLYCANECVYEGGDHKIIIGRVLEMQRLSDADPLLYYRSGYRCIGNAI